MSKRKANFREQQVEEAVRRIKYGAFVRAAARAVGLTVGQLTYQLRVMRDNGHDINARSYRRMKSKEWRAVESAFVLPKLKRRRNAG